MRELILGGVRSGKSRLAERRAAERGGPVVYVATAEARDGAMAARIAEHRAHRPKTWRTVEESLALAETLDHHCAEGTTVVVDCLTLWLNNLLAAEADGQPDAVAAGRDALLATLPHLPGDILMVANETGLGVVPANPLARRFCDEAGRLHQDLAAQCERVIWTVAGLPHVLKDTSGKAA